MSKINRRQQILESLALMLQERPGNRITTASLAAQVGVSEAALYRHFPSKGKMLEGLIVFAEETLFSRITLILDDHDDASARCRNIIFLLLSFIERNPGFARLFVGDALQGETERLRARIHQLLNRLETQLRQIIREHNAALTQLPTLQINPAANLLLCFAEGRIQQFVRSDFTDSPTRDWETQWTMLNRTIFE
ncbi:MAG: nucleoid occlusion factor SlmA [Gammaproteobacteria bacterium]|jgi:TetR/AcrR family transcriptional regulator|nr:nucleoid occlusion factor SlmA [Gammaproteobacteria bacterium]MCH1550690.1 nucleoid occlusion factor SlmA [Pseudomonadales bacterium]